MSNMAGGIHDGTGGISDVAQLWSLPWHELHRRLVGSVGLGSAPEKRTATIRAPVRPAERVTLCAPTVTWLARARSGAWPERAASK
jgi:hypothetical protein